MTIPQFLKSEGLDPAHSDFKVELHQVIHLLRKFSTMVRDKQIEYCAVASSAHILRTLNFTKINEERMDEEFEKAFIVKKVQIEKIS